VKVSVCMATYNRPQYLERVLRSIVRQSPPFDYEIIVADDAPQNEDNRLVCMEFPCVTYIRVDRPPGYMNPARARNVAYRAATGEIIICQSDDVEHRGEAMAGLVDALKPGTFVIATVFNVDLQGRGVLKPIYEFTGPNCRRPLFFLGALYLKDLYAVGGNDERFVHPGLDDNWFADCLKKGLGLRARYATTVIGSHLSHERPSDLAQRVDQSMAVYKKLTTNAKTHVGRWTTEDAPWTTIPRRMSFFWISQMSWLRWLTLKTFRLNNPDWEVDVYVPTKGCSPKRWKTHEDDDNKYKGIDYRLRMDGLNINFKEFAPPDARLAAAQMCDFFEWELLGGPGGFYADLDILWLKPLDPLWKAVRHADAMWCLEDGLLAIGLMASKPGCRLFEEIGAFAASKNHSIAHGYQDYGTNMLYEMFPPHGGNGRIGTQSLAEMKRRYPGLNIVSVSSETVYPFDWREIGKIFEENHPMPANSIGMHWFGGDPISQKWNGLLTEKDWWEYENTFTNCLVEAHESRLSLSKL